MRTIAGRPEIERINFLTQRDGKRTARAWVERTLSIYREAITKPGSHASTDSYRPLSGFGHYAGHPGSRAFAKDL